MKDVFDENNQIELTDLHTNYQTKLKIIFDKIEQLENEEVLLKTRVNLFSIFLLKSRLFVFECSLNNLKKNQIIMKMK